MWALQSEALETESETKISQVGIRVRDMKMCRTDRQTDRQLRNAGGRTAKERVEVAGRKKVS